MSSWPACTCMNWKVIEGCLQKHVELFSWVISFNYNLINLPISHVLFARAVPIHSRTTFTNNYSAVSQTGGVGSKLLCFYKGPRILENGPSSDLSLSSGPAHEMPWPQAQQGGNDLQVSSCRCRRGSSIWGQANVNRLSS